jgi:hypothetical protein
MVITCHSFLVQSGEVTFLESKKVYSGLPLHSLHRLAPRSSNADASHKNVEIDFRGITGIGLFVFGSLLLA